MNILSLRKKSLKNLVYLLGKFADWVKTEWGARLRVADLSCHVGSGGGRRHNRLCTHSQIVKSMYERLQLHLLQYKIYNIHLCIKKNVVYVVTKCMLLVYFKDVIKIVEFPEGGRLAPGRKQGHRGRMMQHGRSLTTRCLAHIGRRCQRLHRPIAIITIITIIWKTVIGSTRIMSNIIDIHIG